MSGKPPRRAAKARIPVAAEYLSKEYRVSSNVQSFIGGTYVLACLEAPVRCDAVGVSLPFRKCSITGLQYINLMQTIY